MTYRNVFIILILFISNSGFAQNAVPEWTKGAVWYQILPERFRNMSNRNDPIKERVVGKNVADWQVHPWASDWYKLQIWEMDRGLEFYKLISERRYGGDLLGVMEKLFYLKALGVDVIYLNPIFEAPSITKYDVSTYHHVDNNFGRDRDGDWDKIRTEKEAPETWTLTTSDEVFFDLIAKAHELEMKVVIEVEFNYSGREFFAFRDLQENQEKSVYKDWYEVLNWDDPATPDTVEFDYTCWQNNKNLPVFKKVKNTLVEPVKKYLFDITRRWMDPDKDGKPIDGIDGWFVSSVEELSPDFWQEWNELVKSINPNAVTVAEFWQETSNGIAHYGFDTITNYSFAKLAQEFFIAKKSKMTVTEFNENLKKLQTIFLENNNHSLLNLYDSHKVNRLATMIKNPNWSYVQNEESGNNHSHEYDPRKPGEEDFQLQKLMAIFQMTYIGAPMIYYGDESGMWGGANPDNLKPMLWKEFVYENETYRNFRPRFNEEVKNAFNAELFNHYRLLGKIRHENVAIQKGEFQPLIIDDNKNIYAFLRKYENNEVLVVLNISDQKQTLELKPPWSEGIKIKDYLNNKKYKIEQGPLKLEINKKWGVILVKEK